MNLFIHLPEKEQNKVHKLKGGIYFELSKRRGLHLWRLKFKTKHVFCQNFAHINEDGEHVTRLLTRREKEILLQQLEPYVTFI
jgi:hypothetical protein